MLLVSMDSIGTRILGSCNESPSLVVFGGCGTSDLHESGTLEPRIGLLTRANAAASRSERVASGWKKRPEDLATGGVALREGDRSGFPRGVVERLLPYRARTSWCHGPTWACA